MTKHFRDNKECIPVFLILGKKNTGFCLIRDSFIYLSVVIKIATNLFIVVLLGKKENIDATPRSRSIANRRSHPLPITLRFIAASLLLDTRLRKSLPQDLKDFFHLYILDSEQHHSMVQQISHLRSCTRLVLVLEQRLN